MKTLKEIRKNSGLKVKKIAQKLNISRRHYYSLENYTTKITDDKIKLLASLFQITYEELKEVIENERSSRNRNGDI